MRTSRVCYHMIAVPKHPIHGRGGMVAAEGLDIGDLKDACFGFPTRPRSLSRPERDFVAVRIGLDAR